MKKLLPKNWVETKLDEVILSKKGKKPKILNEVKFEGSVPYLDIKAFEKNEIRRFADVESSNLIKENEIAIVWDGARSGWVSKGKNGAVGSTLAIIKPLSIESEFLYRFLQSKYNYLTTNTRGIGIPHVDPTILWNLEFPLPPLAEQQRIVAKLDELFGHLDTLKTRLNKIPQILKNFIQAVLTQAVTGKLTQEWRVGKQLETKKDYEGIQKLKADLLKNGKLRKNKLEPIKNEELIYDLCPEFWHKCIFDDLFRFIDYRGKTPQKTPKGLRLITAKNIKMGFLSNEPIEFMSEDAYEGWMTRGFPTKGDIFFVTEGHTMGNVALNNREDKFALAQRTLTLQSFSNLKTTFFYYLMLESRFQLIVDNNATGTAAKGIKAAKFKNLPLIFPSLEEQTEIVKRVEHLFAKADTIEAQYQSLKTKIDRLPQAILAKAFKGELVEQLPTDGDAKVLLEGIQKLKTSLKPVKKSVKTKKKKTKF